ncbi:MAG: hypothetical protein GF344_13980, partial [Chitinivibrionales bacterium]|nr:hypothetical protein [Chitinivibrionales bacterium]
MWMIVIPPEGAARVVADHLADAYDALNVPHAIFDMGRVLPGMRKMLKHPDEQMVIDWANEHLAVRTFDARATHVMVLALCRVSLFTLNIFRKHGIKTIHWFYEDFRRAHYWRQVLPGYDYFAAIQHGPVEEACGNLDVNYSLINTATALMSAPPADSPEYD